MSFSHGRTSPNLHLMFAAKARIIPGFVVDGQLKTARPSASKQDKLCAIDLFLRLAL